MTAILKITLLTLLGTIAMVYTYVYWSVIHKFLMRKRIVWYRWVYESIKFRKNVKALKALSFLDKIDRLTDYTENPRRFHKHWFGKRLNKILIKEIEKYR